ncbi:hypothetical protein Nepgr_025696 [Nepenthes gracilis]|uniref:HhH-GPD domain-containing protein n=1 Tax=Nepenthes gracilis TaxID=150966 RepID=A0AAD3T5E7_NEPGR|nr:hypothetical protein Nepgr_025696 [Nepenthes gracilis]
MEAGLGKSGDEKEEDTKSWFDVELPLGEAAEAFDLEKAVCSHGLFMMAPNKWDPLSKSLLRPLRLNNDNDGDDDTVLVRVSHPSDLPHSLLLRVLGRLSLSPLQSDAVVAQVRRMLRLSEREERKVREFQLMHAEAKKTGFGRVFRSPTLFEDMVKSILFCNCQWPRTLSMARALCELQLELSHHSSRLYSGQVDHIYSKAATTGTEWFTPRTPSAKESLKRFKRHKISQALWREGAEAANVLETRSLENSISSFISAKKEYNTNNSGTCCQAIDENCEADSEGREPFSYPSIGNFPSPKEIASLDEKYLAKRCNLGYRAGRILKLAQSVVDGRVQLRELEELCAETSMSNYDKVDEKLKEIHGFGPFTRGNVLMCMGFYNVVPADSETIRHLKQVHGRSTTTQTVQKAIEEIYREFEPFQFLAYWSEMWDFYEKWFGKLSEMPPSEYRLITASNMRTKRKLVVEDSKSLAAITGSKD